MPALTTEHPARFLITDLLTHAVQPFPDLDDETFEALQESVKLTKGLAAPILVGEDLTVVDGSQRLRSMLANGRTWIARENLWIIPDVDRSNADEWAWRLNTIRRHITPEDKGRYARWLQRERRLSQRAIAARLGVRQATVNEWLKRARDKDEPQTEVEGLDGKVYTVAAKPKHVPKSQPHPLAKDGYLMRDISRTKSRMEAITADNALAGLDAEELEAVNVALESLYIRVEEAWATVRERQGHEFG